MEPPQSSETYIHRSGRTGRAGRPGLNIIVHSDSRQDQNILRDIEQKVPLQKWEVPEDVKEKFEFLNKKVYRELLAYEASAPRDMPRKSFRPSNNQYSSFSKRLTKFFYEDFFYAV